MSEDKIREELESFLEFSKDGRFESWSDGDCMRFTENLATVLEGMEQTQLGEMRDLISLLIDGGAEG